MYQVSGSRDSGESNEIKWKIKWGWEILSPEEKNVFAEVLQALVNIFVSCLSTTDFSLLLLLPLHLLLLMLLLAPSATTPTRSTGIVCIPVMDAAAGQRGY